MPSLGKTSQHAQNVNAEVFSAIQKVTDINQCLSGAGAEGIITDLVKGAEKLNLQLHINCSML